MGFTVPPLRAIECRQTIGLLSFSTSGVPCFQTMAYPTFDGYWYSQHVCARGSCFVGTHVFQSHCSHSVCMRIYIYNYIHMYIIHIIWLYLCTCPIHVQVRNDLDEEQNTGPLPQLKLCFLYPGTKVSDYMWAESSETIRSFDCLLFSCLCNAAGMNWMHYEHRIIQGALTSYYGLSSRATSFSSMKALASSLLTGFLFTTGIGEQMAEAGRATCTREWQSEVWTQKKIKTDFIMASKNHSTWSDLMVSNTLKPRKWNMTPRMCWFPEKGVPPNYPF